MNKKEYTTHGVWINQELIEFTEIIAQDGPKLLINIELNTVLSYYSETEDEELWYATTANDFYFKAYCEGEESLLTLMEKGVVMKGEMPFLEVEYFLNNIEEVKITEMSFLPLENSFLPKKLFKETEND